jgi:hypothetical protein
VKKLRHITENEDHLRNAWWWHGSASGDLRGGTSGLHLGTHEAAKVALNARIGIPAEGTWDGTREYGKTKLAGNRTLEKIGPYTKSGHNCHKMDNDYFPHEHPDHPIKYDNGEEMPMNVRPSIKPYAITGPMTNTKYSPHSDSKANGLMKGSLKKGNAKKGYFYKNDGEDVGSISAVVPNGSHVKELK